MKPFYSDDLVSLYLADSREFQVFGLADVVITDPPYGMAYRSNSATVYRPEGDHLVRTSSPTAAIEGDGTTELRDWLLSAWHGPALVFGTWHMPRPACAQLLVWDKGDSPGMGDLSLPWGPSHEEIYVIGSGFTGKRTGSVLRVNGYSSMDADRPKHPTPKPVALMSMLIAKCPPEWMILDPFAGSGSTLVAAKMLGRKAIGLRLKRSTPLKPPYAAHRAFCSGWSNSSLTTRSGGASVQAGGSREDGCGRWRGWLPLKKGVRHGTSSVCFSTRGRPSGTSH